jgi:thioredoxin reductase
MPASMLLKSDGFASNLSSPQNVFTLKQFCAKNGVPYSDTVHPVTLQTFCAYGLDFQKQAVPELEQKWVSGIEQINRGFQIKLDDGEVLTSRNVVLAVGITHFNYIPPVLEKLSPDLVSHSSRFGDVTPLRGRSATVIGGGASACDLAVELAAGGADVSMIVRSPVLYFGEMPSGKKRSLWQRVRHPSSGLGASLQSRIYADAPWFVHMFPQRLRSRIVRRHLGPKGFWAVKEKIQGRLPLFLGTKVQAAEPQNGKVRLTLRDATGNEKSHVTDHLIAATGYRPDINQLRFLGEGLRTRLRTVDGTPILSRRFESSVPGLYFTGLASAASFGPVMRFVFGVDYTVGVLARHLAGCATPPNPARQ